MSTTADEAGPAPPTPPLRREGYQPRPSAIPVDQAKMPPGTGAVTPVPTCPTCVQMQQAVARLNEEVTTLRRLCRNGAIDEAAADMFTDRVREALADYDAQKAT